MARLRDYEAWHTAYDDPGSPLSWRLRTVRRAIAAELDRRAGEVRVLSACAGDGRDLLWVLADRDDDARVTATLVELHPVLAARAREAAAHRAARIDVRETDAGTTDAYAGAVPADVVLMVGVFGKVDDADLERTVRTMPPFCAPGATLIWTHGRRDDDRTPQLRGWLEECGFTETGFETLERASRPSVGLARYDGPPVELVPGAPLFTFVR